MGSKGSVHIGSNPVLNTMKRIFIQFSKSRVYHYVIYAIPYLAYWKLIGFEFSIIMLASTILGEIHYQNKNNDI